MPRACDLRGLFALFRAASGPARRRRLQCGRWRRRCRACAGSRSRRGRSAGSRSRTRVMLVVIVATRRDGAADRVRASAAGTGRAASRATRCPRRATTPYIEFSNRLVAGADDLRHARDVARRAARRRALEAWVRRLALATFLGTLAQAPLGAITVYYDLNPWLVLSHFLLSLAILTLGVLIVLLEAFGRPRRARCRAALRLLALARRRRLRGPRRHRHARDRGRPASRAASTCGGSPRFGSFGKAVYWHVRATAVFGISLAVLLVWLARRRSRSACASALLVVGVLAVQMAVGEIQYRTELPWWLVLVPRHARRRRSGRRPPRSWSSLWRPE